ncbi:dihydroorotate dehydrogenase [Evansella tamaricis]|uniref:Dihydroorotate dehydrogenase n=1 Tax=Evansella tamaricis TaxID=2069301 RepID=A0ABS6JJZ7_9BACI|nr:dihydroorotate dehydrogenase [Evansella tamaricis]MBU9713137.1 dihydroorotate dehydrogenase [Evansella tamaricis]
MPDWSYHLLFNPVLKKLPSRISREFIHRGMNRIASFPGGKQFINFLGREESSPLLKKEIHGSSMDNSIGLSGKLDPLLSGTKAFSNLGFGFIEMGPISVNRKKDEKAPIVFKNKTIGFPTDHALIDLKETEIKLKELSVDQPVLLHLTGDIQELIILMTVLEKYADMFIFPVEAIKDINLLEELTEKPYFFRINQEKLGDINLSQLDGNSCAGIVLEESKNVTPITARYEHLTSITTLRNQGFKKTIITEGGILEPEDALCLLDAGADLVMLLGGYVFSGPGLPKRIKEAQVDLLTQEKQDMKAIQKGWEWYFLFGFSILIGGIIALYLSLTSVILPYDEYFLGMSRETLYAFNDRIIYFMAHDRMTLAGTMISGGLVYMALARYGIRHGLLWAKQATDTAAIIGFLGIFLFIGYGYFDWLHLLFWIVLAPFYILGYVKTKGIRSTPSSKNRRNHTIWKRSLIGQLAFVILGFSFVLGGIVISTIGVSSVFVPTDLQYICMPPGVIESFNDNLIPVIAHDRAGFGSALLSVGLLVLMLALWAFQQGNLWVWWTFLIGGIPAFLTGIGVHFLIGYTDFIHLLPAYFALFLYIIGLLTSFSFFHKEVD